MFKKTFIRLVVLGTLAFALFFVLVSAQKARQIRLNPDCTESETKMVASTVTGILSWKLLLDQSYRH